MRKRRQLLRNLIAAPAWPLLEKAELARSSITCGVSLPKSREISVSLHRIKSHPILSHSADAQDQEHEHRACAAGLPGIYNVDLVSHIKGDSKSLSWWSRGVSKPKNHSQ